MNRKKKSEVTKIKENLRYLNWYKEGISQSEKYPWVWKTAWMDARGNKVRKQ